MFGKSKVATYISAIERHRSFSAAAKELGLSQPALSSYMKKTEEELGAPIFDRSSTPIALTDAGLALLEYEEEAEALRRRLAQKVSDIENLQQGQLVVGGASSFNVAYLAKTVAAFSERFPGVSVSVVDGTAYDIAALALEGKVDVFITPRHAGMDSFAHSKLLEEKIFLCIPRNWPIVDDLPALGKKRYAAIGKEHFALLKDCPFVLLHPNQQVGIIALELFEQYGFEPMRTITAEQTSTSLALTIAGAGASFATESSLANQDQRIIPALYHPDSPNCNRVLYVATPNNRHVSHAARMFTAMLLEEHGKKATSTR